MRKFIKSLFVVLSLFIALPASATAYMATRNMALPTTALSLCAGGEMPVSALLLTKNPGVAKTTYLSKVRVSLVGGSGTYVVILRQFTSSAASISTQWQPGANSISVNPGFSLQTAETLVGQFQYSSTCPILSFNNFSSVVSFSGVAAAGSSVNFELYCSPSYQTCEAGNLSAFHSQPAGDTFARGWLVIIVPAAVNSITTLPSVSVSYEWVE